MHWKGVNGGMVNGAKLNSSVWGNEKLAK